ncbi:hypothetical protein [Synechococcus sp. UW140]|uniref:hypothetical protein n=1 Tax=Synechococcus sp. UW140 TaxID=368503 RepID=UPI003137945C
MHRWYKKQQNQAAAGLYQFLSKRKKQARTCFCLLSRGKSFSQMSPAIPAARSQKSPAGCGKAVENYLSAVNCSSV